MLAMGHGNSTGNLCVVTEAAEDCRTEGGQKFQTVIAAMAERGLQLKEYCRTGVCVRSAQVRTRCGRSLKPQPEDPGNPLLPMRFDPNGAHVIEAICGIGGEFSMCFPEAVDDRHLHLGRWLERADGARESAHAIG